MDECDDPDNTSGNGVGPLPAIRRAWYKLTGAWPSKWSQQPPESGRGGGRADGKEYANEFKLLPAPGSKRAKQSGFLPTGVVPRSAGIYEPSTGGEGDSGGGAEQVSEWLSQPPLVVMIGWFNAEKKYVDQHIALYKGRDEELGWDVVWFPVPAYTCLVPFGAYRLAEKILGVLELLLVRRATRCSPPNEFAMCWWHEIVLLVRPHAVVTVVTNVLALLAAGAHAAADPAPDQWWRFHLCLDVRPH